MTFSSLALAGCAAPTRPRYQLEAGQDSVRWLAVARDPNTGLALWTYDTPYALVWPSGRVMNLWVRGQIVYVPRLNAPESVANYFCAFRGQLPFNWAMGDTIRGVECAATPDTTPVVSGSFWAVVEADTMHGEATVDVLTFAGTQHDTQRFRLEGPASPSMN